MNTLSYKAIKDIVVFLTNYSEQHGLLLPDRVPGFSRTDIKLLSSSVSKRSIWKKYRSVMEQVGSRAAAYTSFCRFGQQLLPYLVLMKAVSDLCWQCQQNSTTVLRAANSPESVKSSTLQAAQNHLTLVQLERSFYKATLDQCKVQVMELFTTANEFCPPLLFADKEPNSVAVKAHYSFDYAQQVWLCIFVEN